MGGLNSLQTPLWVRQCFYHYCVVLMTCVLGTCESFFLFESNLRIESAVYTTQAVTRPDGPQACRTGL